MRKIKRFLSALLCGAILITGTLAGVSVRTDAAASSYAGAAACGRISG